MKVANALLILLILARCEISCDQKVVKRNWLPMPWEKGKP